MVDGTASKSYQTWYSLIWRRVSKNSPSTSRASYVVRPQCVSSTQPASSRIWCSFSVEVMASTGSTICSSSTSSILSGVGLFRRRESHPLGGFNIQPSPTRRKSISLAESQINTDNWTISSSWTLALSHGWSLRWLALIQARVCPQQAAWWIQKYIISAATTELIGWTMFMCSTSNRIIGKKCRQVTIDQGQGVDIPQTSSRDSSTCLEEMTVNWASMTFGCSTLAFKSHNRTSTKTCYNFSKLETFLMSHLWLMKRGWRVTSAS